MNLKSTHIWTFFACHTVQTCLNMLGKQWKPRDNLLCHSFPTKIWWVSQDSLMNSRIWCFFQFFDHFHDISQAFRILPALFIKVAGILMGAPPKGDGTVTAGELPTWHPMFFMQKSWYVYWDLYATIGNWGRLLILLEIAVYTYDSYSFFNMYLYIYIMYISTCVNQQVSIVALSEWSVSNPSFGDGIGSTFFASDEAQADPSIAPLTCQLQLLKCSENLGY